MGDVFKEQIVKRQQTAKDFAIKACLWILFAILGFGLLIVIPPQFALLLILALGFGANYLMGFLNVEYEYVFTNGELDIDVIYNRARRKRVFTASVKSFEIMAHVEDLSRAGSFDGAQEVKDFSSGVVGENTYAFMTNYNSKRLKVIIEPNEKMLKAISGSLSRSKLHLRPGVVLVP